MKKYTVKRDRDLDIEFTGEVIAGVSSYANSDRWTELVLYKTPSGKFICQIIGRSRIEGEYDRFAGTIVDNERSVIEYFGLTWLSKELFEVAGIDASVKVDL